MNSKRLSLRERAVPTRTRAIGKNRSATRSETLQILPVQAWAKFPWLLHGFSTRVGGFSGVYGGRSLNLGFTKEDRRPAVERNRALFLKSLGVEGANVSKVERKLVTLRQVHSDVIHSVDAGGAVRLEPLVGDGMVTDVPGLVLAVQTADCLPVIFVDPKRKAVGVFHAGWRGTLRRIVEKGVGEMRGCFGSDPSSAGCDWAGDSEVLFRSWSGSAGAV